MSSVVSSTRFNSVSLAKVICMYSLGTTWRTFSTTLLVDVIVTVPCHLLGGRFRLQVHVPEPKGSLQAHAPADVDARRWRCRGSRRVPGSFRAR